MVPRPEVVALSVDLPPEQCLEAVMDSPYTRYPVYRESLDNVVGILHVRDLFSALRERGMHEVKVEEIVRPAHIVPETKDLAALLTEFRRANQHMAIVVDEYGEMEGIVTLEDLLEEIVGEIEDEFDLPSIDVIVANRAYRGDLADVAQEVVELDDVAPRRACRLESTAQVLEHLPRLRSEIAFAHQLTVRIEGYLARDVDDPAGGGIDDVAVAERRRQCFRGKEALFVHPPMI